MFQKMIFLISLISLISNISLANTDELIKSRANQFKKMTICGKVCTLQTFSLVDTLFNKFHDVDDFDKTRSYITKSHNTCLKVCKENDKNNSNIQSDK